MARLHMRDGRIVRPQRARGAADGSVTEPVVTDDWQDTGAADGTGFGPGSAELLRAEVAARGLTGTEFDAAVDDAAERRDTDLVRDAAHGQQSDDEVSYRRTVRQPTGERDAGEERPDWQEALENIDANGRALADVSVDEPAPVTDPEEIWTPGRRRRMW